MKEEIIKYIDIIINNAKNSLIHVTSEESDAILSFYNWLQEEPINISSFSEVYFKIDKINLNPKERKFLDEFYKVIQLFESNEFIKLDNELLEKFINNPLFISVEATVTHLYSRMIKNISNVSYVESNINYWETFKEILINLPEGKYIDNLDEFNDYLYKDKSDLKYVKIPLLDLIFKYNMNVGNRNYKELSAELVSTKVDQTEVIELFKKYGYDFTKAKEEIKNKILANCTIEDITAVLEFYKKYNIKFDISKDEKYLVILYKTNKDILSEIEDFVNKYHLSMRSFLLKTPSAFALKNRSQVTGEGNIQTANTTIFAGSFQDFKENINFIESLGYDVGDSYRTCPSIFVYSSSQLKKNVEALKMYGIDIAQDHDNIKLSGLRSSKILFTIDQFIELGELDYLKQNTSRLQLEPDSFIFYRLYYVKKYNKLNMDKIEYHGRIIKGNMTYKSDIVDINNKTLGINNGNRKERVFAIESDIIPDDIKTLVNEKLSVSDISFFDKDILNDPEVVFFENNFYYDDITYVIAGKVISRLKFLRLYSALCNSNLANNHELALYALTYNTIMSPDEYEIMMEDIQSRKRGLE